MNTYDLSRAWFNFCFDHPEKINPNHTAIYFFAIEHCNRLGWKKKFGFPSQMTMDAIGIKKHQTYIKYFNDLVDWKFFKLIQKSKNQYSSNIISLVHAIPKNGKALDKAIIKHGAKQTETIGQSNSSINKQVNQETNKQVNNNLEEQFDIFWADYPRKTGKGAARTSFAKALKKANFDEISSGLLKHEIQTAKDPQFIPHPSTWLNQERWADESPKQSNLENDYSSFKGAGMFDE